MDPSPPHPQSSASSPELQETQPQASATTASNPLLTELSADESNLNRSNSTRRLQESLSRQTPSDNTAPAPDKEQLHAIIGQHLAVNPTISKAPSIPEPPSPAPHPFDITPNVQAPAVNRISTQAEPSSAAHDRVPSPSSFAAYTVPTYTNEAIGPDRNSRALSTSEDTPSHFGLLGADMSNDVYKWHEKEARQQVNRAQTYHAPQPSVGSANISHIKAPGGFRRHFLQHDAAARGDPAPHIPTKSFIDFLGLFNMYEFEHFAGENFRQTPRRSIVVPKDLERRRKSFVEAEETGEGLKYFRQGQEIEEDETVIEEPEEQISFSKAVGMLFKTFIASGILFLPNAFKNGGILFSSLVMTLIAVLCLHSFLLLVKCRELQPGSYGEIGGHLYGRWMRYIVLFAIAISQFGFCCGYCIFFAQQFAIVVDSLGGAELDKIVWIAIFFVILVPFTLIRNISKLGFSTLIADLCIIVGLIYLYAYDIKQLVIHRDSPLPLQLFNSKDFGLFIGTAVFSYEGIGMVIPICGSMKDPRQFPRALTIVLTVVCVLLVSFGALGYAAYGANVQTIVLDDLPRETGGEKAGKNAIQLLYIIAIFLTTPLMLFPCIRIIEHMVFRAAGTGPRTKARLIKENIVRIIIDFAVAAVAYAGYTKLDIFISFVGSFACAPLLFIFPPLFHFKAFPNQPIWRKVSDIVLILFGFLVFFYTLVITIQSFSNSSEH